MRVILHPGATLATGSSFHNRKVGRTNPVGHAGSKSEPTNANNLVSVDFLPSNPDLFDCSKARSIPGVVGRLLELQSSVFPKLWHRHPPGRDAPPAFLDFDKGSDPAHQWRTCSLGSCCKMFVRGGQIGPESLCILILSFPTGAMTLVRSRGAAAGSVPTSPAGSPACLVT